MATKKKRGFLGRLRKWVTYICFLAITATLLFEVIYRYQVIDFYNTELTALNPDLQEDSEKPTLLVFGDSFSADSRSWVQFVRDKMPRYQVVNAAVPGIGIRETLIMAEDRIETFKPKVCIYQIYMGNDLFDIDRPANWSDLSVTRNLYWQVSDGLLGLRFLNYRFGQFRAVTGDGVDEIDSKLMADFDPADYSARTQLMIKANPDFLEDAYFPTDDAISTHNELKEGILELRKLLPEDCELHLVIIPHCAATSQKWRDRYAEMGATFSDKWTDINLRPGVQKAPEGHFLNGTDWESENIKVINLHTHLLVAEGILNTNWYYENDPHLTPEGQSFIGPVIVAKVAASGILDALL